MNFVANLLVVVQILAALGMVGLILMQHGKGADMGAAFGSGASGSLFGATGSANFLSRATAVLATVFLISTLGLAYFGFSVRTAAPTSGSVLERASISAPAPATGGDVATELPAAAGIPTDDGTGVQQELPSSSGTSQGGEGAGQIPSGD